VAYAPTVIAGTTGLLVHPIGFPYLSAEHVRLTIDTVELARGASTWEFSNEGTEITFQAGPEPATGEDLVIFRATPTDVAPVTFRNGSGITASDLNDTALAALYAIEELSYHKDVTGVAVPAAGASSPGVKEMAFGTARFYDAYLLCTSNDTDFDAGDEVRINETVGFQIEYDDTWKQYFLFQATGGGTVLDHSGNAFNITEANWTFEMRAWPSTS
jgi:hypothetical protein